ncbi:MAG: pyridoxamine 5-phosphate oxidase [Planctomycetota bacterium]|nr:MAG: pyridoxamine 5-phosphate oxidase [Planctomycetota bacterium]
MSRRYYEITFTPSVVAAQARFGVAGPAAAMAAAELDDAHLGEGERAFIAARDSFYMASVTEDGWPYLQHRGGSAGFLRVLDDRTLAFADFRGNKQLLSTGNLDADDRVALFLMDYPNRRRLKLMARCRVVSAADDLALAARVEDPDYRARVERVFVFTLEAFDWNCPQHISPRFTAHEVSVSAAESDGPFAHLFHSR